MRGPTGTMLTLNLWNQRPLGSAASDEAVAAPRARRPLLKIAVLNSKGGCGKTTLSTSLAAYYAARGYKTALLDTDPQGSSLRWLANRGERGPHITGVPGYDRSG